MPGRATIRTRAGMTAVAAVCSICHRPDLIGAAEEDGIIAAAADRTRITDTDLTAAIDHHYAQHHPGVSP